MVNSNMVRAWEYKMVEMINQSAYCKVVLIVQNTVEVVARSKWQRLRDGFKYILFNLYKRLDRRFFSLNPDPFVLTDLQGIGLDAKHLKVLPRRTKYSDYINDEDILTIRESELDVMVRLGFRILKGEILSVAKYGIWSFHHGDNKVNRGGPPGFWEVYYGLPETGAILQVLREELDDGVVISRTYTQSNPYSVQRNLHFHYWKALHLLPRALERLSSQGGEMFFKDADQKLPLFFTNPLYRTPVNSHIVSLVLRKAISFWRKKIGDRYAFEQWQIGFYIDRKQQGFAGTLRRYRKLVPPKDRFWADPFVIAKDNKFYIFFEELVYERKNAHISCIALDEKGKVLENRKVLERPYHLSYPFVFAYEEEYYMIPESCQNKTIELYRATDFPYQWELETVLMQNINAVDATLLEKDNRWYLFTNVRVDPQATYLDELFVFVSDSPLSSDWKPLSFNPQVSDVKRARPAGKFIDIDGEIYRPSQNNSGYYGRGLNLMRCEEITEHSYREVLAQELLANWADDVRGIHTINHDQGCTVIDLLVRRRK